MQVEPNAVNVIPGRVTFSVDFRAQKTEDLAAGDAMMREIAADVARRRGLALELSCTEEIAAVPLDTGVCERLRAASRLLGLRVPDTASGALHDTAILAPLVPSAMLFVASKDGLSHNPAELSRAEDIACAADIIVEAVSA
jgi:acetylornithine deacetylase/succinyl-diaminopimelate desuccinylase-like protein